MRGKTRTGAAGVMTVDVADLGATGALAARALGVRASMLSAATVEHAKQSLLDLIGSAVRARFESETSAAVHGAVVALGSEGACRAIGYASRFSPQYAALLNGCNFHALDFDDTHELASLHPGAPVVAAVLAEGERLGSDGRAVIAAIVAGYDVAVRVGLALNPRTHYARGFHPSATAGVFGATAAAAHLHGDSVERLESAFGINLSQAAGSLQFSVDGAQTKPLQVGLAAHNAVLARQFAAAGLRGPRAALEGRSGLLQAYSDETDPSALWDWPLGEHEIDRTAFKPYPCCRYMHAAIDLLTEIVREHRLTPASVERIRVSLPAAGLRLCAYPEERKRHPQSIVDAQFSMYYAAAASVLWGSVRWDDFTRRDTPEVAALTERVSVRADPEVEALVPAMAALVEVDAGHVHERRISPSPRGEPGNPLEWPELSEKFNTLAAVAYRPDRRRRILDLVHGFEKLEDVRMLTAELGA